MKVFWISTRSEHPNEQGIALGIYMSLTLEREYDDYVTIRRLNQRYLYLQS